MIFVAKPKSGDFDNLIQNGSNDIGCEHYEKLKQIKAINLKNLSLSPIRLDGFVMV